MTKLTAQPTDVGDKISVSVGYKKNIGNYESMDWHVSASLTHRDGETTEELFKRGWETIYDQIDEQVSVWDEEQSKK